MIYQIISSSGVIDAVNQITNVMQQIEISEETKESIQNIVASLNQRNTDESTTE